MNKAQVWLQSFKENEQLVHQPTLTHLSKLSAPTTRAKTISVTAGKGGVGKTSVALKIAMELAKSGKRTLLIDCDFNLSNTLIKLGLPISDHFLSLVSGQKSFEESIVKMGQFHLLAGCNGNVELLEKRINFSQLVIDIVIGHEHQYDYILLDCPAGLLRTTLQLNAYTNSRFIVVSPDKSSLTDSYSLIKVLKTKYGISSNHLIVNKVSSLKQYQRTVKTMSETVENFLGGRTYVLGGIKHFIGQVESFDQVLFNDEDSVIHKNFLKVIENFTEKFSGSVFDNTAESLFCLGRVPEQDVQTDL